MSVEIRIGDVRERLREMPDASVDCVVTSPPYWGLRDYGTARWDGGDPDCAHTGDERYYTEKTAAQSSGDAFSVAGEANAERLRKGRWREGGACTKCGARHSDPQIGLEPTLGEHLAVMVAVFRDIRRVLKPTGTVWLNYGDCYATAPNGRSAAAIKANGKDDRTFRDKPFSTIGGVLKAKDLCMVPARLAIALQEDGWWIRSEIVWHKPNPMPESITDRPTSAHEKIYLLSRSERYYYDAAAVKEDAIAAGRVPGGNRKVDGSRNDAARDMTVPVADSRNLRNVWTVPSQPFSDAHFATFPPALIEPCIKAGCPVGGTVLDPFFGAGTTGLVADRLGRNCIGIELNPEYAAMAQRRIETDAGLFASFALPPVPQPDYSLAKGTTP